MVSLPKSAAVVLALAWAACHRPPASTTPPPASPSATPASPAAGPTRPAFSVVPLPATLEPRPGPPFTIGRGTGIAVEGGSEARRIAEVLAVMLRVPTGYPVPVGDTGSIRLRLTGGTPRGGADAYSLDVDSASVSLVAAEGAGLFRGVQTIRQLLPFGIESENSVLRMGEWRIPAVTIRDHPRFAWRGAMLDVSRHFFTVDEVKQYIDLLTLYKLNVLHLHLSDDQGWRIEIKSRPRLVELGSAMQVGPGQGGYYTQADYAEIVRYAQDRYITVVPEIDMPGHSNAALIAYPELSCGRQAPAPYTSIRVGFSAFCPDREETYQLIDDIVREISAITPGPYFHIGGDEVETLTREQYARFVERVQGIVHRHGKRMVGWEEIYKATLDSSTLVQQWRSDSARNALRYGTRLIVSHAPKLYLDMKHTAATELGLSWAGLIEVSTAYDWDPARLIAGVTEGNIVGIEAPLWAETVRNITAAQYLAVPRLPAYAEVGWTPQSRRSWEDFRQRIAVHARRWRLLGINYYPSPQIPW